MLGIFIATGIGVVIGYALCALLTLSSQGDAQTDRYEMYYQGKRDGLIEASARACAAAESRKEGEIEGID